MPPSKRKIPNFEEECIFTERKNVRIKNPIVFNRVWCLKECFKAKALKRAIGYEVSSYDDSFLPFDWDDGDLGFDSDGGEREDASEGLDGEDSGDDGESDFGKRL